MTTGGHVCEPNIGRQHGLYYVSTRHGLFFDMHITLTLQTHLWMYAEPSAALFSDHALERSYQYGFVSDVLYDPYQQMQLESDSQHCSAVHVTMYSKVEPAATTNI